MEMTTLGRTGFRVSRMGLGCGGHSRLGTRTPGNEENAVRIVREALDLGVNFIDTAEAYGTEEVVGRAIARVPRDQVILSTKVGAAWDDHEVTPSELRERLDGCLRRLGTEYVDVFHLHGVRAEEYAHALTLVPTLLDLKQAGKIRAIGITEAFIPEPSHAMLAPAMAKDDFWDVVMVGFSLLNQSAARTVLPHTMAKGIGTLCMFAVRRALSNASALRELMAGLVESGQVDLDVDDSLGFLVADGVASSLQEVAYRFCLHEPGLDVILSGTGNIEHLRANVRSLSMPPLPSEVVERLRRLFGRVDSVSGN
ncbi:MAG: aldo/keto reductase [Armatimonadetes bacterium]|nr:aldo/keto reductase [Armatimonadota bacterium]